MKIYRCWKRSHREHAIGYKIHKDNPEHELYFVPGNAGCESIGRCISIAANELDTKIMDVVQKENKSTLS